MNLSGKLLSSLIRNPHLLHLQLQLHLQTLALMAKPLLLIPLSVMLLSLFSPRGCAAVGRGGGKSAEVVKEGELWCVAKNNAEDPALQTAIDWACGPGGADCKPIQQGGRCFQPEDIQSHASYAFNDYYVRHGSADGTCDFSGTAALTSINPSTGTCVYPSSSSARNGNFSGPTVAGPTGPYDATSGAPPPLLLLKTWPSPATMALALLLAFAIATSTLPLV